MSTHSYRCNVFVRGAGVGWVEGTKSSSSVVTRTLKACFRQKRVAQLFFKGFLIFLFQQKLRVPTALSAPNNYIIVMTITYNDTNV